MVSATSILAMGAIALSAFSAVLAHEVLYSPVPRGAPMNAKAYKVTDWDLNGPLNDHGDINAYPCKHKKIGQPTANYTAGEKFVAVFEEGNTHKGGHCQFALSLDAGKTFVVLRTIIDICFMDYAPWTYHIDLPKGVPSGPAVFMWAWFNAEGKRQMYTNCADVNILNGTPGGSLTGPEVFVAQLRGKRSLPEWGSGGNKDTGSKYFAERKIITTPPKVNPRDDGTVKGEPGNGKPGNVPTFAGKIPWARFHNDDGYEGTEPYKRPMFFATSRNPGPGFAGLSDGGRSSPKRKSGGGKK